MARILASILMVSLLSMVALSTEIQRAALVGQNPEFDIKAAEEEAYWYSRYNLEHLVIRSGLGEIFTLDMSEILEMVGAADADPNDGDVVTLPNNPASLRVIYAGGDPRWTQEVNPMNFATTRWAPETFDKTITGAAIGWTMITEVEWAKQFHVDAHFGKPSDRFGAQQRFLGMVLITEAQMQGLNWIERYEKGQAKIVDRSDLYAMLMALSNLGHTLEQETLPHSTGNRYHDPEAASLFLKAADALFKDLRAIEGEMITVKELALAIQGLIWYAATTHNKQNQLQAIRMIMDYGDRLTRVDKETATGKGYAIRGLIEAYRVTEKTKYRDGAVKVFNSLVKEYDPVHGTFTSQNTYTIDDVAAIVGGLNALKLFSKANKDQVNGIFTGFFESVVNLSGLQQSAPPEGEANGKFEQDKPSIYYRYPEIPPPSQADDAYGIAPVFARAVTLDLETGSWVEINRRFDTAGAMHAACEFIWLHYDEVNGFPKITLPKAGINHVLTFLLILGLAIAIAIIIMRY